MTTISLYPRLVVAGAAAAIDFYVRTLDAKETERYTTPDGKIVHAQLTVGGSTLTLKDEDSTDPAPGSLGGTPVIMTLDVSDADAVGARMEEAGATVVFPIGDTPYGQRMGRLRDPFGHLWMISQDTAEVSAADIQRAVEAEQH